MATMVLPEPMTWREVMQAGGLDPAQLADIATFFKANGIADAQANTRGPSDPQFEANMMRLGMNPDGDIFPAGAKLNVPDKTGLKALLFGAAGAVVAGAPGAAVGIGAALLSGGAKKPTKSTGSDEDDVFLQGFGEESLTEVLMGPGPFGFKRWVWYVGIGAGLYYFLKRKKHRR